MPFIFVLKRFLGQFLAPLPMATALFVLGYLLHPALRRRPGGVLLRALAAVLQLAAVLLFIIATSGLLEGPLYRLEQTYPPFDPDPVHCETLRGSDIVVLGQGLAPNSPLPIRFRDNDVFRNRITEAARIAHWVPGSRLLVSMAGESPLSDKQAALADYADLFNLPTNRLVLIADGLDTETEASLALSHSTSPSLIIVTSASHLPRAMHIFERAATNSTPALIPAPTDYRALTSSPSYSWTRLPLPSSRFTLNADRLFHESFGRLYEKLREP